MPNANSADASNSLDGGNDSQTGNAEALAGHFKSGARIAQTEVICQISERYDNNQNHIV
jgi:hypothetical protein